MGHSLRGDAQVLAQRALEQHVVLWHQSQTAAKRLQTDVASVDAVNLDGTTADVHGTMRYVNDAIVLRGV